MQDECDSASEVCESKTGVRPDETRSDGERGRRERSSRSACLAVPCCCSREQLGNSHSASPLPRVQAVGQAVRLSGQVLCVRRRVALVLPLAVPLPRCSLTLLSSRPIQHSRDGFVDKLFSVGTLASAWLLRAADGHPAPCSRSSACPAHALRLTW